MKIQLSGPEGLKIRAPFFIVLFMALSFLIYFPALKCGFELDAHYVVENNPVVKQPGQFKEIFAKGFFDAYKNAFDPQLNYYRPLTILSFAANYHLFGKEPSYFRMVNIILHGLNSFLVFLFMYVLFKRKKEAVLAGVIFCILPVQEWVVNYIVGRGDLLQISFSLIALILFILYLIRHNIFVYLLSLFAFLLALLSREPAILLPFYVTTTAFYYYKVRRGKDSASVRTLNQYITKAEAFDPRNTLRPSILTLSFPFYLIAAVYYVLRQMYFPIVNPGEVSFVLIDLLRWLKICFQYNTRYFFPWSIFSSAGVIINNVWFCVGFLMVLTSVVHRHMFKTRVKDNVSIFWFSFIWLILGSLAFWPTRHAFAKQGFYLAEHFLYFSTIGFSILLAQLLLSFQEKKRVVAVSIVIILYGAVTFNSSRFWTTEENLLRRVYAKEKSKQGVAYRQLIYKFDENIPAMKEMIIASKTDAERSLWSKQVGRVYRLQNKIEDAIKILQQSIEYNADNYEAMLELSLCYLNSDQFELGKEWLEKIIAQDPNNAEAYRVLGEAYYYHNDYPSAIKNLEKALSLDPDYETILQFLAMAYYFNDEKSAYLQSLTQIEKSHLDIHEVMQFIIKEFYAHGQIGQVMDLIQQNKTMFEKDADTLNILAATYFNKGKKAKAREIWKYILTFDPQNKDALRGLMAPDWK